MLYFPVLEDVRLPILNQLVKDVSELSKSEWAKQTMIQRVQIIIDNSAIHVLGRGSIRPWIW